MNERLFGFILPILWLLVAIIGHAYGNDSESETNGEYGINVESICNVQKNCASCMAVHPSCVWCDVPDFPVAAYRCDLWDNLNRMNCPGSLNQISVLSKVVIEKNEPPRNAKDGLEPVQLSPQIVRIKARANSTVKLSVNFTQAANYPVDIYFVLDASNTMKPYKDMLASLTNSLVERIKKITTNYRLGFGSFVDKTIMPYISTAPDHLREPCKDCNSPYGFINHLNLTQNHSIFQQQVSALRISGNLDAPEGSFDAVAQAVACTEHIGWRENSRKMILLFTDAEFHYAGDGKLAGIVEPHDLLCHLDENGVYTFSLLQDYPSIAQLASLVAEKKVNLIFAVTPNQVELYNRLSRYILGSSVGQLSETKSFPTEVVSDTQVIDIVEDNYNKIRSSVELKIDPIEDVTVEIKSNCKNPRELMETNSKCENIGLGEQVSFELHIKAQFCSGSDSIGGGTGAVQPDSNPRKLEVNVIGLTEKLIVYLETDCTCPCQAQHLIEKNSPKCSNSGTLECGACRCNSGFYGNRCECASAADTDDSSHDATCRMNNSVEVCSNRGRCVCGTCSCHTLGYNGGKSASDNAYKKSYNKNNINNNNNDDNIDIDNNDNKENNKNKNKKNNISPHSAIDQTKRYSGPFCECNDYNCDYFMSKMCAGNGVCKCGNCVCQTGFTGNSCECSSNNDTCRSSNGEICNGKGNCLCGKCYCNIDQSYKGPTCEDCPTCQGKCEQNRGCVQCSLRVTAVDATGVEEVERKECLKTCPKIEQVSQLPDVDRNANKRLCSIQDDDMCYIRFIYIYDTNYIYLQRTKECPNPMNNLIIIGSVMGGIIVAGIMCLVAWKSVVTVYDRREFEAFQKETKNAKWNTNDNPLYRGAVSNFQNPTFVSKQQRL